MAIAQIYDEPQHVDDYLCAMLELRVQYKKWLHKPTVSSCPLCQVGKKHHKKLYPTILPHCDGCPWTVLTDPSYRYRSFCRLNVFYKTASLTQKSWLLRKFKFLRDIALVFDTNVAKRIEELELWISIYSRYRQRTMLLGQSPGYVISCINKELKEGTFS